MDAKICGVKDTDTLKYIVNHKNPPKFVGFITNYKKSKRYIEYKSLKKLININKKGVNFVSVLVNPNEDILEKIKNLNFDYYQIYDSSPEKVKSIKKKYNKKIISAITVKNKEDVEQYKKFASFSDILLFDSKGYEKSLGFDHKLLDVVSGSITKMLAGNIKYDDRLDKYSKITDIIDISGSLETSGKKDISKINFFLENFIRFKNAD
tara:strand:+ start:2699 stop:3322 length:624 start_codon:yes stop_codon:yes gene_type:complete